MEQPRHPALPPGSLACGVGVTWPYMVWDRLLAPASWEPSSTREVRTALCRGSVCEGSQHFRQRTLFKGACGYTRPHEADGPPPSSRGFSAVTPLSAWGSLPLPAFGWGSLDQASLSAPWRLFF